MPFLLFPPLSRRMVQMAESSPYMLHFSPRKMVKSRIKNDEFQHFADSGFFAAYMGVFWSGATAVFIIFSCHMTRVLKTVSGRNFAHFQQISSGRKNAEFHLFSSGWKFWPAFAVAAPGNGTQSRRS